MLKMSATASATSLSSPFPPPEQPVSRASISTPARARARSFSKFECRDFLRNRRKYDHARQYHKNNRWYSILTNSYHVHVSEPIDAFTKLKFEADFQRLSPGGAISYVEVPNMQDNLEAVISVLQFIYDNIMYAELNTKSDYCQVCGYDGEIMINDNMEWECPQCHNKDHAKMNVTRRTCGYLGENFWNAGKTKEIKARVLHL